MKKALHRPKKAFFYEKNGELAPEEMNVEEIVEAVNRGIKGEWEDSSPLSIILQKVYDWICRYIDEGPTDAFFNELNSELHNVQYFNYVLPPDFYSPEGEEPQSIYAVNMNIKYTPEAYAAKEFARFVTCGMLSQIRRCQLSGCEKIFLGPPQAKWCSKSCGSKYRVSKKRKRDAS